MKFHHAFIFFSILTTASQVSLAFDCLQESPNLSANANTYYDWKIYAPTSAEEDGIRAFFSILARHEWKGTSQEKTCLGTFSNPRIKIENAEIEVSFSSGSNNAWIAQLRKEFIESKKITNDSIGFAEKDTVVSLVVMGNTFQCNERYRRGIANGGSVAIERITTMTATDKSLAATITYFTNGIMSGEEHWQLSK